MKERCQACTDDFDSNDTREFLSLDRYKKIELDDIYPKFDHVCKNCLQIFVDSNSLKHTHEKIFTTLKGEFKIKIKKTRQKKFFISIYNKKYGYPLLKEEIDDEVEVLKEFNSYCKKIEKGQFKIIRNFEALDSHYRRIFTRVRYGILIL